MARTIGVEEEFLVLDAASTSLRPLGEHAARLADRRSQGQFEHELKREQAELGSQPHVDLDDLGTELRARRRELARSCADHGARIVAAGLSPLVAAATPTPDERYERLAERFGETARAALSCGMHVHVGIDDRAQGVAVLDAVRAWLPVLLALSANSPFLDGRDTGHQSYRSMIWQRWPSGGPTATFTDVAEYERVNDTLVKIGAALDRPGVYFDTRLSESYPTVEIRVADVCPRVEDAVTLAGLTRALVTAAADGALPRLGTVHGRAEIIRAATWRAARFGVEDVLWHPVRGELVPAWSLVDDLAELLGVADDIGKGLASIRERGTGSRLQRDVHERTGSLDDVVETLADLTVPD